MCNILLHILFITTSCNITQISKKAIWFPIKIGEMGLRECYTNFQKRKFTSRSLILVGIILLALNLNHDIFVQRGFLWSRCDASRVTWWRVIEKLICYLLFVTVTHITKLLLIEFSYYSHNIALRSFFHCKSPTLNFFFPYN
jgi:hypothetical protein